MPRALFIERFGDIYEHTPVIAERAHRAGLRPSADTADGLHAVMATVMRAMGREEKLALIRAHPDLAGRLALAKQLTVDSTREQGSAGLDRLTAEELARFTGLNDGYKAKFGFPFIFAVKGKTKDDILASFESRMNNGADAEFDEALRQIERIALLRLKDRLA
jgi:OHCU decarboxylase